MSTDSPGPDDTTRGALEPHPAQIAEIDRLNDVASAHPDDLDSQVALWREVTALEFWVGINRGTPEALRPYMLAAEVGTVMCIYSSATRAKESALANGLISEDEPVPLFIVSLPQALDWALSFGEQGVTGVTIDYPRLGAWCPLPNLARLRDERAGRR